MDWFMIASIIGYLIFWFISTAIFSKTIYRYSLEKAYIQPKRKNRWEPEYTEAQLEVMETERRKKLAKESIATASTMSIAWPFLWVVCLLTIIYQVLVTVIHKIAISPVEAEREKELIYSKAKRIVVKYEEEQRLKFNQELGE